MKKIVFIIMLLVLTGCVNNKVRDLEGNIKDEFSINETAVYKNINYTVINVEYTDIMNEQKIDDETKQYLAITFEIKNNSNNNEYSMDLDCILETQQTSSEQETVTWLGEFMPIIKSGESYSDTYYMEIRKTDEAEYYDCGNFVFKLNE